MRSFDRVQKRAHSRPQPPQQLHIGPIRKPPLFYVFRCLDYRDEFSGFVSHAARLMSEGGALTIFASLIGIENTISSKLVAFVEAGPTRHKLYPCPSFNGLIRCSLVR